MPPNPDKEKCTGCGDCVNICPVGALEIKDGKVVLVRADECIDCRACESACENSAIIFK